MSPKRYNNYISSFKKNFGRYQHLVEKYFVSCVHITKDFDSKLTIASLLCHKGNNKITELRIILQRQSQNS